MSLLSIFDTSVAHFIVLIVSGSDIFFYSPHFASLRL